MRKTNRKKIIIKATAAPAISPEIGKPWRWITLPKLIAKPVMNSHTITVRVSMLVNVFRAIHQKDGHRLLLIIR